MTATVQWEAYAGVTHAWIAQCEGYVSLCGREVSGFGGQRSGIRCAQCTVSSRWAEQTGQESYLTPRQVDAMYRAMAQVHGVVPERRQMTFPGLPRHRKMPIPMGLDPSEVPAHEQPTDIPTGAEALRTVAPGGHRLSTPDSIDAYHTLPDAEQRYWAPVMLARAGEHAIWDQATETAEQFQQRCYEQLGRAREEDSR